MELTEGSAIGPYRLVGRAGSGGMAEVWRAFDARLKRSVAIKFVSPRFATDPLYLDRFRREAQAISMLDHPNILQIHDFGEQDGWTYMVSPYIGGGTLATRLGRGGWTVDAAIPILEPLASALDYAHSQGIIHRDVKPSNVLFTDQGRLILTDFGIARMVEQSTMLSQAGMIVGTPMYMSPEQADGQPVAGASDLYSLGVIAYEMLTGRPPFLAETPIALLRAHIDKPLPPPRSLNPLLSDAVEEVLFTIMAKDPADRFVTGQAFIEALQDARTRLRVLPEPVPPVPIPDRDETNLLHGDDLLSSDDPSGLHQDRTIPLDSGKSPTTRTTPTRVIPLPPTRILPLSGARMSRRRWLLAAGGVGATALVAATTTGIWHLTRPPSLQRGAVLRGHTDIVRGAAFVPAGDLVVSASTDGTVRTWQTSDGKLIQTLDCDGLGTMMASPDGRLVAIAAFEATRTTTTSVWLLGVQDGTRRPLVGQTAQIQATAFSGDGTLVAATGYGPASTVVWRVEDATVIQSFAPKIHDDGEAVGRAIAVSHDGRLLAAAYMPHSNGVHGGQILIWDLTTGNEIQRHSIPSPPNRDKPSAWSLAFNRSGSHLAASTSDDEYGAFVFPVAGGDRVLFGQGSTRHVSFSDDGRSLTVLRWNQGYERWRVAEKTLETRTGGLPTGTGIRVVGVSGDGRTTAVTEDYNGYIVSLWRSPSPS